MRQDAAEIAMAILAKARLSDEAEHALAALVIDHCHLWGEFYGPASSIGLARLIAHRCLDGQGYNWEYLVEALQRWAR